MIKQDNMEEQQEKDEAPKPFMSSMTMTFGVAQMTKTKIEMDSSKAMSILGFSSSQSFDATAMEDIQKAFLYRMNLIMKAQSKNKGYNPRKQESRRMEIRKLNEALQHLTKKRNKSERALMNFRGTW